MPWNENTVVLLVFLAKRNKKRTNPGLKTPPAM
jgi:hypothetical protein